MEFDSSSATNFPHLSDSFPQNPYTKPHIPTMVHVQPNSILPPHPSHNTALLYKNNIHEFQSLAQIGANHHSSIPTEGLSFINPFRMIPTPTLPNSYKAEHTIESRKDFVSNFNLVTFAPNNKKIEGMYGYPDNSKNLQHFYQTNSPEFGQISEPQDEISCMLGSGGKSIGSDLKLIDQKQQTIFQGKNSEIHDEDTNIIKGQWTAVEDRALTELVEEFGYEKWAKIARSMKWRNGNQCRDRWNNHLRPNIKKEPWNEDDEQLLIVAHKIFGNKWSKIAKKLSWRSENSIKNHWNTTKRRLNAKRKQSTHNGGSKGTLLLNYIKEVIASEGDEKEMKKPISVINLHSEEEQSHINDLGFASVPNETSESYFSPKYWATQEHEVSGSVPVMLKEDKMASRFGIMDYELGVQMLVDDLVKKEMDFLDMIYLNP